MKKLLWRLLGYLSLGVVTVTVLLLSPFIYLFMCTAVALDELEEK